MNDFLQHFNWFITFIAEGLTADFTGNKSHALYLEA
jgi:hypothetical protein